MKPEHIIDELVMIKDADIEEIFDKCLLWLRKLSANIVQQQRPNVVEAIQYHRNTLRNKFRDTTFGFWHPDDWEKNILITLQKKENNIDLRLIYRRPKGYFTQKAIDKRKRWYLIQAFDLFKFLRIDIDEPKKQNMVPMSNLGILVSDIVMSHTLPMLGSIIMWIWGYFTIFNNENFGYFLILAGFYIPFQVLYDIYIIRNKFRELYPDVSYS